MRNRADRLSWIENMLRSDTSEAVHDKGIVIPSSSGLLCIAFASVIEVTPAKNLKSLSFLPKEFCGVIDRGSILAPVIDMRATPEGTSPKVILVSGNAQEFGICYEGTPHVVNLNEYPAETTDSLDVPFPLIAKARLVSPLGSVVILDIDAMADYLLAQE